MKSIFCVFIALTLFTGCKAQQPVSNHFKQVNPMDNLTITPEFEKFDTALTQEGKDVYKLLPNGALLDIVLAKSGIGYSYTPVGSYFMVLKSYYPNGYIKHKGLFSNVAWTGFEKGIWYYFNPDGTLKETIDHDKPFALKWEDLLKWLQNKGIPVDIGPVRQSTGFHTMISRYISENGTPYWKVEWLKTSSVMEVLIINGRTGAVAPPTEEEFINN